MARDQSPLDGTTAGDQLALRREQSHSAKPGSQRLEESSGLKAGLHSDRPGAGPRPSQSPCSFPCVDACPCSLSYTTHVHTHSVHATHTDTYQPKLDALRLLTWKASEQKPPPCSGQPPPSQQVPLGKGWSSGERRAEVRGQQSPTGQLVFEGPQAPGQAPTFLLRKMSKEVGEGPGC